MALWAQLLVLMVLIVGGCDKAAPPKDKTPSVMTPKVALSCQVELTAKDDGARYRVDGFEVRPLRDVDDATLDVFCQQVILDACKKAGDMGDCTRGDTARYTVHKVATTKRR